MKKRAWFLFTAVLLAGIARAPVLQAQDAFKQAVVINPKPGTWANKQSLVLDVPDGSDVFYSIEGSNPLVSGFAYDGPVLIDAEGDVTLRLATVAANDTSREQTVLYTVNAATPPKALAEYVAGARYQLTSRSKIMLPAEYLYCLGEDSTPKFSGRTLSLSAFYPERFVPCTVFDGENLWRFIIAVETPLGETNNALEIKPALPFEITNWTRLVFTQNQFIYSIDGGAWKPMQGTITLDRNSPHKIQWKNADARADDTVYFCDIPSKPGFDLTATVIAPGGAAEQSGYIFKAYYSENFFAQGDGYTFTCPQAGIFDPTPEIPVDALYGEEISAAISINAYYHGVYQGNITLPFMLDRRPPDAPAIVAANNAFFNRSAISLALFQKERDVIFYAIESSAPDESVFVNHDFDVQTLPVSPKNATVFSRYQGNSVPITVGAGNNDALVYTLFAYTEDPSGNKSGYAVYHAFIDTVNYYLSVVAVEDDSRPHQRPDGSLTNPFTSFEQALNAMPTANARLHILSDVTVSKSITITSPCSLAGNGKTRIKLLDDAQLICNGTSFSAKSLIFEKTAASDSQYLVPVIVLNNATARFNNCTFAVSTQGSSSVFSLEKSTLDFESCLVSLSTTGYGAAVLGKNSTVSANESTIILNAETAVAFSLEDSTFTLENSRVRSPAPVSRAAELISSTFRITGNNFAFNTETPVWFDRASTAALYANNTQIKE